MDDKTWFEVDAGHPQFLLKQLIQFCGVDRHIIESLNKNHSNRLFLTSEMMRPATTSDQWQNLKNDNDIQKIKSALNGVRICEADNDHHEATIIALALLEIAADPEQEKTGVLITPNRYLAMRVQMILKQWGIDIDDSGGTSLNKTSLGQFCLSCLGSCLQGQIEPISFLSALKNPYASGEIDSFRSHVKSLEKELFRGVKPSGDFESLYNLSMKNKDFVAGLMMIFKPLSSAQEGMHSLQTHIQNHIRVMENLAKTSDQSGADRLWRGDVGEAFAQFFVNLQSQSDVTPDMTLMDYQDLITSLLSQNSFTARYGKHPRISILGQIEARMIACDRVILAGLNEVVWPADSGFDAWMSRIMRADFGLPSLEQKTSLSAHDFSCGFCAADVFVTRSKKTDGAPTLPSRWLNRLHTILEATALQDHSMDNHYAQWARDIRHSKTQQILLRPQPTPSIEKRPTQFSVTEIEKWMRDPYWIYAKKILDLRKMDSVDMDLSMADRGTIIHTIIERYTKTPDIDLITLGKEEFETHIDNPEVYGFWWPRFEKSAQWFLDYDHDWRLDVAQTYSEIKGEIHYDDIRLTGKLDRLDVHTNGSFSIIDYKTGSPPSPSDVNAGIASQLPLEGLILSQNGFNEIGNNENVDCHFHYWVLNGAGEGGKALRAQGQKGMDSAQLMQDAYEGIQNLFAAYNNDSQPYIATPDFSKKIPHDYNSYAHLQRILEWSVLEDES